MYPEWMAIILLGGVLGAMLGLLEFGRRLGERRLRRDPEWAATGLGAVEGAVFSLMGLLIAFTFAGAASRFDARRAMVVEEANAIGTAWLRIDLIPAAAQPPLRAKFRDYAAARLAVFSKLPDLKAARAEVKRASALQTEIWAQAIAACRDSGSYSAPLLLLPALNQMFDAATTRTEAAQMHPPLIIYQTLVVLVLASSLLAGYDLGLGKVHHWLHALAFVLTIVFAIYVIVDFEFPRLGLIRINAIDQVFVNLLESMKP